MSQSKSGKGGPYHAHYHKTNSHNPLGEGREADEPGLVRNEGDLVRQGSEDEFADGRQHVGQRGEQARRGDIHLQHLVHVEGAVEQETLEPEGAAWK